VSRQSTVSRVQNFEAPGGGAGAFRLRQHRAALRPMPDLNDTSIGVRECIGVACISVVALFNGEIQDRQHIGGRRYVEADEEFEVEPSLYSHNWMERI